MAAKSINQNSGPAAPRCSSKHKSLFNSIKFFVFCHGLLQLAQLLVSGYLKSSISTIERRYGFSSKKSGFLAAFNEVGNTILIVFVSFFGSRVHRPRFIGGGALLACLASLMMALPHFISGPYKYTGDISSTSDNSSELCQSEKNLNQLSNQSCSKHEDTAQQGVYPLLLLGQLLLGIGTVPIQPFGISYIDDFSSKKNSPLYLGLLLAATSIGPGFGFILGSFIQRLYVDIDKAPAKIQLDPTDLRWVGAWWLGFLVAAFLLFLTSLPYMFFPREMPKEDCEAKEPRTEKEMEEKKKQIDPLREVTLLQFLKSFPHIALRTLRNPVYLLVVLAQVFLAALVAGIATFMAKFIERQFGQTASASSILIGGINIPLAVLGIVLGGALMRRMSLSVTGAAKMCCIAILSCLLFAFPLLFIGCSTQEVADVYPMRANLLPCSTFCQCADDAFNPVCGSDGKEFRSPCHAGCQEMQKDAHSNNVLNYTMCGCVGRHDGPPGFALPGTCGSGCSHLLLPFMVLSGLTCFVASTSQTPSFMMILRTVPPEDKSFAVGIQYMLFRVLAFMPAPVLYGIAIDSTCILWGKECNKKTSCHYYHLDLFRRRFLGLQGFFVSCGLVCFLLSFLVLKRQRRQKQETKYGKGEFERVNEETSLSNTDSKELENIVT